jgi:hypothetical protein
LVGVIVGLSVLSHIVADLVKQGLADESVQIIDEETLSH